ncbi:exodeoxyribonuclease VII large subunit [Lapillicoccus sp.]|uniref:exodeoxyribonuclease VII large subunit n=1 Tax=Lapillicoccus sp. TaxID=1909287 RepID=UPI0025EE2301|nr:exodeoxyribonuclease VII large subunit [Lapillicoccus sp.]
MSQPLPERAADTSAEQPWPVRHLSMKIVAYVDKMSSLWVEGQVVQVNRRGNTAYLVVRDPEVDMSLTANISIHALNAMPTPLIEGARVVLQAKPSFWPKRGTLSLDARQIRPVGIGDLLARIEVLKQRLAQEGLFDRERKRPLPFLPRTVGLITGRESAAEKDVVENARRRWPSVQFVIREVAVQGSNTVLEVTEALRELDADNSIDVIIIARGGGSAEELLPFSNETLLRAVSEAVTPVVSAIGHDVDQPLLDLVADWRASTPTDAGKRVVPDAAEERARIEQLASRAGRALIGRLGHERHVIASLRSRPVMADPTALVVRHREQVSALRSRGTERLLGRLRRAHDQVGHLATQVRALSPQSTLERGYAVVQHADGRLVTDQAELEPAELLRVRVAHGDFGVRTVGGAS